MPTRFMIRWLPGPLMAVLAGAVLVSCGGSGGGSGSPTSPSPTTQTVTVTLTADGPQPREARIQLNQKVRFVNNTAAAVEIRSNPHPSHTDCPPINEVTMLAAGASGETAAFTRTGSCAYHNNQNESDRNQGFILVGVNEPGPSPGYLTPGSGH